MRPTRLESGSGGEISAPSDRRSKLSRLVPRCFRPAALTVALLGGCSEQPQGNSAASKNTEVRPAQPVATSPSPVAATDESLGPAESPLNPEDLRQLVQTAADQEGRREYASAVETREQIVTLLETEFGRDSWQATNARLSVRNTQHKLALTPEQHAILVQIAQLETQAQQQVATGQIAQALEVYSTIFELAPQIWPQRSHALARYAFQAAEANLAAGDYARAEQLYNFARPIQEEVLGREHPDYATTLNSLGVLYHRLGRHEQAVLALREAVELTEEIWGAGSEHHATPLNNLGAVWFEMGQFVDAADVLLRALTIRRERYGEQHFYCGDTLYNVGALYLATGDYDRAVNRLEEAAEIHEKAFGSRHAKTVQTIERLADAYHQTKQYAKAESLLRRVLDDNRTKFGGSHELTITSKYHLGLVLGYQAKYEEAEPYLAAALHDLERLYGDDSPQLLPVLRAYVVLLDRIGRPREHHEMVSRVEHIEFRDATMRPTPPAIHR